MSIDITHLPVEITTLILLDAVETANQIITAVAMTSRLWRLIVNEHWAYSRPRDIMSYYLGHNSISGVMFARSLGYKIGHREAPVLVTCDIDFITKVLDNVQVNMRELTVNCLRVNLDHYIELLLNRGWVPPDDMIATAAEYGRFRLVKSMLATISTRSQLVDVIGYVTKRIISHGNLLHIMTAGLELKQLDFDPRVISVVIRSVYVYSHNEPEFIIRWILDNLNYQPICIPKINEYKSVNNMLKQKGFTLTSYYDPKGM
jgi:hypothetical protein